MNEMVRNILPWLLEKGCRVIHLTGNNDCFYKNFNKLNNHANLVTRQFSNEISAILQNADLAISRSGSGAICELMVTKTPSILIPYPTSADQHQELNAAYLAGYGGAVIVNQHDASKDILKKTISTLINSNSLNEMKSNMNNCDYLNSELKILDILNSIS